MIHITFVFADGERRQLAGDNGDTVLDVALDNAVAGIKGQCGGGCTCCTCHCWIHSPWFERLPVPHQDELDLLDYAWGRSPQSRLACQVVLAPALDGMRVEVPAQQS